MLRCQRADTAFPAILRATTLPRAPDFKLVARMSSVPLDFRPSTPEELAQCLNDPVWRIGSGYLYKIITKGDEEGSEGLVVPFRPRAAQWELLDNLHSRNDVVKARQLGFSTLILILWLDTALFSHDPINCGIIAQDKEAAEGLFEKVKFAWQNLPPALLAQFPAERETTSRIKFAHNGSSIRVATSMRSGTIHRLHVSEFGKICAKYPDKAKEVMTGSIPAVPLDGGILVVESTTEGQSGEFYEMTQRAEAVQQSGRPLTPLDFRLHFFPWFDEPRYRVPARTVVVTPKDHEYFDAVEAETGAKIDADQRAWYVNYRDTTYPGNPERMWQEYPSSLKEAFQRSTEGTYYPTQLAVARRDGRICRVPFAQGIPVNTFWDIGARDGTGIWFHQQVGLEDRFLRYEEGWGEPYSYFADIIQKTGWVYGTHFLPHDAQHKRQQGNRIASPIEMLEELMPGHRFEIVPRVDRVIDGIQLARNSFSSCWFDEEGCKEGLVHLASYRKEWDQRLAAWKDEPRHDEHSESADAFRQWAQAKSEGLLHSARQRIKRPERRRSGMVA